MFTAHCAVEQKQRRSPSRKFSEREFRELFPIIAVLVAIAVPLFVTGLQKAQRARDDANARAVKSAAVVYILNAKTTDTKIYNAEGTFKKNFEVVASVDQNGKIALTSVEGQDEAYKVEGDRVWYKIAAATIGEGEDSVDGWTITVYISSTDLDADLSS